MGDDANGSPVFNNHGQTNWGPVVQGRDISGGDFSVHGNTYHAPKTPEEVAESARRYQGEWNELLKAEKAIAVQASEIATVGGIASALWKFADAPFALTSPFIGGAAIGTIICGVRFWDTRRQRGKLPI
ncbi:hypothetical protein [Streptomyces cyaneofuscatus]|uniref:hypothetical protein n=1 Tax=Streptomyces cyaneofuscatus TaxID=66883 RepID=UPI0036CBBB80